VFYRFVCFYVHVAVNRPTSCLNRRYASPSNATAPCGYSVPFVIIILREMFRVLAKKLTPLTNIQGGPAKVRPTYILLVAFGT